MTLSQASSRGRSILGAGSSGVLRERARAKLNLTLHVLGRRPDGYHELESLVVFADFGDTLSYSPGPDDGLRLRGPFSEAVDGENLVLKAKRVAETWLSQKFRGEFVLDKHIPVAAGLGGGSSDAAAALRILLKAYGGAKSPEDFTEQAAAVGADVPVCLYNRAAWMRGLGERVAPAEFVSALAAVLVNPRVKLSTADVFKKLAALAYTPTGSSHAPLAASDFSTPEMAALWLEKGRNDLEAPAISLEPAVEAVLNALRHQEGNLLSRLSGSGPTCFGLFVSQEAADEAAAALAKSRPGWWVVATTLS